MQDLLKGDAGGDLLKEPMAVSDDALSEESDGEEGEEKEESDGPY